MDLATLLRDWQPDARFYGLPGGVVRREWKSKGQYPDWHLPSAFRKWQSGGL